MTDAVERVARALAKAGDENWDAANFNETLSGDAPDEMREYWRHMARAAILALREPTPEMVGAFWRQKNTGSQEPGEVTDQRDDYSAWRAAIDAALQEPSP